MLTNNKDSENDLVLASLKTLGIDAPDDEDACMYNAGLIDSFGVMQLVLQLEIEAGGRLAPVVLMKDGGSITRNRFLLESLNGGKAGGGTAIWGGVLW